MSDFQFHTIESAPEAAKSALEGAQQSLGFVPSLYAGLAESPQALEAYLKIGEIFGDSTLTAQEQQVVLLATSVENGCEFCVAAHSFLARNVAKLGEEDLQALRENRDLPTTRLQTLADLTRQVVRGRGRVNETEVAAFIEAGFTRANVLEVVLGVTMKTLSNYANHLLETPLDEAFAADRWTKLSN